MILIDSTTEKECEIDLSNNIWFDLSDLLSWVQNAVNIDKWG